MATVVETPQHKRECLKRTLAINPQNSIARHKLRSLGVTAPPVAPALAQRIAGPAYGSPSLPAGAGRCPNCAAEIDAADRRCRFCGSLLRILPHSPASRSKRESLSQIERWKLTGRYIPSFLPFAILTYVFVGIVIGVLGAFFVEEHLTSIVVTLLFLPFAAMWVFIMIIHPAMSLVEKIRLMSGSRAEACIIDIWVEEGEKANETSYYIAWEFTVPDQRGDAVHFRKAQSISRKIYSMLAARDTVFVRYVPREPQCSELDKKWLRELEKR